MPWSICTESTFAGSAADNRFVMWTAGTTAAAATVFDPWTRQGFTAETERMVEALNWTVVFLMAMPYVTVAGCVGWLVYRYTRAHRARESRQGGLHIVRKGEC